MGETYFANVMKNMLIVFEGIDGVGKTSISKGLCEALINVGVPCLRYEDYEKKEEGFNVIKPFINEKTPIDASLFFFIASAIYKSQEIEKLLQNQWVICDRYVYSTLAYNQARGADTSLVASLEKLPIIKPDYYFLICTDESVRIKRLAEKQDVELIDFEPKSPGSFFDQVEQNFLKYKPIVLDNSESGIDIIIKRVFSIVRNEV